MKPIRFIVCLIFVFLVCPAYAQEKYSRVKFFPPKDLAKRAELLQLLQIDHFAVSEDGSIESEIGLPEINKLKGTGYKFEILIDDITKDLLEKNKEYFERRRKGLINMDGSVAGNSNSRVAIEQTGKTVGNILVTPAAFQVFSTAPTMGGYYTFAQMNAAMNTLVATYPTLATKTSLGTTVNGNNIWCIKISDNAATDEANEPEVLLIGLQHAREAIGGSSMIFLMQYLCERYAVDQNIKDLVNNREIFIIPCMNPDGWEQNRTTNPNGGGLWRKNRKVIASGPQYGVDLNRNWSVDWANCPVSDLSCGDPSATTANDTYWGTAAFSELETQAVSAFVKTRNFVSMIDQHAYGPYYSLPFGRPSLHTGADTLTVMEQQYYTQIPSLMGKYNGMRAGNSSQSVGYEVAGGVKDWMLKGEIGVGTKGRIFGMTGEGGYGATATTFWPPAAQIINLSKGMAYQDLQLIYAAGSYADIQDVNDIAVTSLSGNFNFTVQRLGLGDEPVTVSLIPLENIATVGTPVTISSMPTYNQVTAGSMSYTLFPSLGAGQRIKFIWKINTGGYTYADTITKFYNPTQLLYDDMETAASFATNWTATSNVADNWAYTTLAAYGGTKGLTESPAGKYSTSTTRTLLYKNSLVLTGSTAAYLSFWTKHRAENFRDKLQVQVSPTGAAPWTVVRGSTTIEEPGTLESSTINGAPSLTGIRSDWAHEVYDLSAFNGTAALRLRFVFTSDNDASSFFYETDDGFYLDNIKVIKTNATFMNLLPLNFITFTGNLLNNNIGLYWEAVTGKGHNYFEVEKSADGVGFTAIGKVTSGAPFNFTDYTPFSGNNYYRIKEVDMDGMPTYSKVINIPYSTIKGSVVIYPNPVTDVLRIKINDNTMGFLDIKISDVQGRVVYAAAGTENTGSEIKINTHSFTPQVYILKVTGKQGNVISIEKFIKQ